MAGQFATYRGSSQMIPDLLAGRVHAAFDTIPGSIEQIKAGNMRALALSSATRSETLPYVPPIGDFVAGYEVIPIAGIVADDPTLDMAGQTTQALQELARILEEHGSGIDRILQILVFITDMKQKPEMNRAWKEFFSDTSILPTRATLGISSIEEGVLIEIVTTAALR